MNMIYSKEGSGAATMTTTKGTGNKLHAGREGQGAPGTVVSIQVILMFATQAKLTLPEDTHPGPAFRATSLSTLMLLCTLTSQYAK